MLPLAYLSGGPTALACGWVAAWETRRRGRPGWVPPALLAAAGAMVFIGRTEWMDGVLVWLVLSHLLAATACTALARVMTGSR